MALHPYDIKNLAVGPARVLYVPYADVEIPKTLQDIFGLISPYKAVEKWVDFGAAPGGSGAAYAREFKSDSLDIEQETSAIFTELSETKRMISLNIAEINPDNIKVIEGSAVESEEVKAAKEVSKQEVVPLGVVSEFPEFRVAIVAMRKKVSGVVKEMKEVEAKEVVNLERGRFVAVLLNRCTLEAASSEIKIDKSGLLSAPITFESFPDPDEEDPDKAYGRWFFEEEGEIKVK